MAETKFPRSGTPEDKIDDPSFGDTIVTEATPYKEGGGFTLTHEGGTSFGYSHPKGIAAPEVGDRIRVWDPPLLGNRVRGLALRGTVLFYRTEEETRARDEADAAKENRERKRKYEEEEKAEFQKRYEALPEAFQRRLDKYRNGPNPDFGWEYEGYELFCCEQAVVYAEEARRVVGVAMGDTAEVATYYEGKTEKETPPTPELRWLFWWNAHHSAEFDYDFARFKELMPGYSNEHSGNTHGTAFQLAAIWLNPAPDFGEKGVVNRFGALAPLVGSEAYGDPPAPEAPA